MPGTPAFQFYTGDYLKDPNVTNCSPATRGIWVDLLCRIHERGTGSISGNVRSLAIQSRCLPEEFVTALDEMRLYDVCDITDVPDSDLLIITSRRMKRDFEKRKKDRDRKRKTRSGKVTKKGADKKRTRPGQSMENGALSAGKEDRRMKIEEEEKEEGVQGENGGPALDLVLRFFTDHAVSQYGGNKKEAERQAQLFYEHFAERDWTQGEFDRPIRAWQRVAKKWMLRKNDFKSGKDSAPAQPSLDNFREVE